MHTIEVTSLSAKATEKDVHDFFAFCGPIERVEIVRSVSDFLNFCIVAGSDIHFRFFFFFSALHLLSFVNFLVWVGLCLYSFSCCLVLFC